MFTPAVGGGCYMPAFQAERRLAAGATNDVTDDTRKNTSAGGGGQRKSGNVKCGVRSAEFGVNKPEKTSSAERGVNGKTATATGLTPASSASICAIPGPP